MKRTLPVLLIAVVLFSLMGCTGIKVENAVTGAPQSTAQQSSDASATSPEPAAPSGTQQPSPAASSVQTPDPQTAKKTAEELSELEKQLKDLLDSLGDINFEGIDDL